jgi:hypothetical protein
MGQVHLLFANKSYDTSKQVLTENQIVIGYGYAMSAKRYVVYKVVNRGEGFIYHLIDIETKAFMQTDLPRPLREKYGIGMYYNDETPEFMDAFEVLMLRSEAEYKAKAQQEEEQQKRERNEQLKAIGRERLQKLIPEDAKAIIVAKLRENESDPMTDYYGYSTKRTVILGFSTHTRDIFSEMRKYAANCEETAYLAEANEKYEHREKYSMGAGYYLGKSKYSGWIIEKVRLSSNREQNIENYALVAGEESNICVKAQRSNNNVSEAITGDFIIVDYSEKAIAVFGDTRSVKEELKAFGGRFNPKLTHEGDRKAGWIFQKSKEQELRNLLTHK